MRKTSGLNSTSGGCDPGDVDFDASEFEAFEEYLIRRGGNDEEQARHRVVFGFICVTLDC